MNNAKFTWILPNRKFYTICQIEFWHRGCEFGDIELKFVVF